MISMKYFMIYLSFLIMMGCGKSSTSSTEVETLQFRLSELEAQIARHDKLNDANHLGIFELYQNMNKFSDILNFQQINGQKLGNPQILSEVNQLLPQIHEALSEMEADAVHLGFSSDDLEKLSEQVEQMRETLDQKQQEIDNLKAGKNIGSISYQELLSKYEKLKKIYNKSLENAKPVSFKSEGYKRQIERQKAEIRKLRQKNQELSTALAQGSETVPCPENDCGNEVTELQAQISTLTTDLADSEANEERLEKQTETQLNTLEQRLTQEHKTQLANLYYSKGREFYAALKKLDGWRGVAATSAKKKIYSYAKRSYDMALKYGHKQASSQKKKLNELYP